MGLLIPSAGNILVDDVDLNDNNTPRASHGLACPIAHVPQSIYLADSSIAENIAFGLAQRMR